MMIPTNTHLPGNDLSRYKLGRPEYNQHPSPHPYPYAKSYNHDDSAHSSSIDMCASRPPRREPQEHHSPQPQYHRSSPRPRSPPRPDYYSDSSLAVAHRPAQSHVHYARNYHQDRPDHQGRTLPVPYQYAKKPKYNCPPQYHHHSQPHYEEFGHHEFDPRNRALTSSTPPPSVAYPPTPTSHHAYSSAPVSIHYPSSSSPSPRLPPVTQPTHTLPILPPIRSLSVSSYGMSEAASSDRRKSDTGSIDHGTLLNSHSRRSSQVSALGFGIMSLTDNPVLSPTPSLRDDDGVISDDHGQYEGERGIIHGQRSPKLSIESQPKKSQGFLCTIPGCGTILDSEESRSNHVQQCDRKITTKSRRCKFPGCQESFSNNKLLARHQKSRHGTTSGTGKFPCTWDGCDKLLATAKSLKDHVQIHKERNDGIVFYCGVQDCQKSFGTTRCKRAHELRCKQVKSGQRLSCTVEGCNLSFGSSDYVRRHLLDHQKGNIGVKFGCIYPDCNALLANPLTLQRHMQLHDEQSFDFEWICLVDNCGKSYSGSKQLTDHQGRIHKELKPEHRFSCGHNTCKKKFKGQREAYKHKPCIKTVPRKPMAFIEVSDLSEDPSDPEEVEEALQVPEVLEDPKVESGSKIACKEEGCTCILPSQLALDEHMYMHKNITAAPPYPCFSEGCNESFGTKPEILKHAITHFK